MKCMLLISLIMVSLPFMTINGASSNEVISVVIGDGYVLEQLSTGDELELDSPAYSADENGIVSIDVNSSLSVPTLPGPESSTNALSILLLEMLAYSSVDNFDQNNENGVPYTAQPIAATWTWEGFLGEDETNGWTRVAKKSCFDWYLNYLSTNQCECSSEQTNLSRIALLQCENLKYTNQWEIYSRMVRNPFFPQKELAGELALRYIPEECGLYDTGMDVVTNGLNLAANERYSLMLVYMDRLRQLRSAESVSVTISLYNFRYSNITLSLSLDRLFDTIIEGYGCSSNRLDTALGYLQSQSLSEVQRAHFETITNQLMNASQPLPEMDSLRGF